MRLYLFIFSLLFLFSLNNFAQVDKIKKESDDHNSGNNSSDNQGFSSGSNDDPGSGCANACAEGCFQILFSEVINGLVNCQQNMMHNSENLPMSFSVDLLLHAAYAPDDDYINYLPRIRGTYGMFCTDFRLNHLAEYKSDTTDTYTASEWQVLQFNFSSTENFNFRIGSGIFSEKYSRRTYNEHSVGFDILSPMHKYWTSIEGRLALDYEAPQSEQLVFSEVNLRTGLRIISSQNIWGHFNFGILYQNYYKSVDLWSVQTGVSFNFH